MESEMKPMPGFAGSSLRGYAVLPLLLAVAGLASVVWLRPALENAREGQARLRLSGAGAGSSQFKSLRDDPGEVRATTADLMWVKTERYLHNGIAYGAHLDIAATSNSGEIKDAHAAENHEDAHKHEHHEHDEHDEHLNRP